VAAFQPLRFPGPPSEPDVRVAAHPALLRVPETRFGVSAGAWAGSSGAYRPRCRFLLLPPQLLGRSQAGELAAVEDPDPVGEALGRRRGRACRAGSLASCAARSSRMNDVPRASSQGPSETAGTVSGPMATETNDREQREPLTGAIAGAYIGRWMDAGNAGVGLDANKLAADARAAQRGNRLARARLLGVFELRHRPRRPRSARSRRATARRRQRRCLPGSVRARSPGRPEPEPLNRRGRPGSLRGGAAVSGCEARCGWGC
jgi:hypothetical protein